MLGRTVIVERFYGGFMRKCFCFHGFSDWGRLNWVCVFRRPFSQGNIGFVICCLVIGNLIFRRHFCLRGRLKRGFCFVCGLFVCLYCFGGRLNALRWLLRRCVRYGFCFTRRVFPRRYVVVFLSRNRFGNLVFRRRGRRRGRLNGRFSGFRLGKLQRLFCGMDTRFSRMQLGIFDMSANVVRIRR